MQNPDFLSMYKQLIASPSISALDPALNMSNRDTINLLACWCERLGFNVEITELECAP